MTPDETVMLTRYVRAMCPQQRIDEYTPDAWHDVLRPYSLDEARTAIASHISDGNAFISVGEIVGRIRQHRTNAAGDIHGPGQPAEIPDADPDDVLSYLTAVRDQRNRAAAGQPLQRRPIAELTTNTGRLPESKPSPRGPLGVTCPRCSAAVGRACRTPGGRRMSVLHPARMDAANGRPTADPDGNADRVRAASAARLAEETA